MLLLSHCMPICTRIRDPTVDCMLARAPDPADLYRVLQQSIR